ncbi:MAG: isocitrate/isopropylmalate dehydrogenase family protein [Rhodothermales bacterium]
MAYTITLLPGDGIGPEVTDATLRVLEATGLEFDWDEQTAGMAAYETGGDPLPEAVVESIRRNKIALKGPLTTPVGTGFRSANVKLRQVLDLFANVRPCVSLPNTRARYENIDLIIFRENTEGLYAGIEYFDERNQIADSIARVTRRGSEKIIRFAFEQAKKMDRQRLTLVHKANILKMAGGMFLEIGRDTSRGYPEIEFDDRIVDNMAMQLVVYPERYDCIVTTNLFGDILSDLAAGLVGGLGVTGGANIGEEHAVFEAVHGSAPDIAGQGKANPTAMIRSAEMMLRYLGEKDAANAVRAAIFEVYSEGTHLTSDLGGSASTSAFAERLAESVAAHVAS